MHNLLPTSPRGQAPAKASSSSSLRGALEDAAKEPIPVQQKALDLLERELPISRRTKIRMPWKSKQAPTAPGCLGGCLSKGVVATKQLSLVLVEAGQQPLEWQNQVAAKIMDMLFAAKMQALPPEVLTLVVRHIGPVMRRTSRAMLRVYGPLETPLIIPHAQLLWNHVCHSPAPHVPRPTATRNRPTTPIARNSHPISRRPMSPQPTSPFRPTSPLPPTSPHTPTSPHAPTSPRPNSPPPTLAPATAPSAAAQRLRTTKHLQFQSISHRLNKTWCDFDLPRLLAAFPTLCSLTLPDDHAFICTADHLAPLSAVPTLTSLEVGCCGNIALALPTLTALQRLVLRLRPSATLPPAPASNNPAFAPSSPQEALVHALLPPLAALRSLRHLDIDFAALMHDHSMDVLPLLAPLSTLTHISLYSWMSPSWDMDTCDLLAASWPSLQSLSLDLTRPLLDPEPPADDLADALAAHAPTLTALRLKRAQYPDELWYPGCRLSSLRLQRLEVWCACNDVLPAVAAPGTITHLSLQEAVLTAGDLPCLLLLSRSLRSLDLQVDPNDLAEMLDGMAGLEHLQVLRLRLHSPQQNDGQMMFLDPLTEATAKLHALTQLTELRLEDDWFRQFPGSMASAVCGLTQLRALELSSSGSGGCGGFGGFGGFGNASGGGGGEQQQVVGLRRLSTLQQLTRLSLSGALVSKSNSGKELAVVKELKQLQLLELLADPLAPLLGKGLHTSLLPLPSGLRRLKLWKVEMGEGAQHVLEAAASRQDCSLQL